MTPHQITAPIRYNDEVARARRQNRPIVALESNVISNGLPYPRNLETINAMETEIRQAGAVPATIAINGGQIIVGLDEADKAAFSKQAFDKISSRDLGPALASGKPSVTTVSASLLAAELAGIRFLASAGLGGVHRGAESSFDISSDLIQLTHSPVVAVTAGAKMILDLGLTLEFLETHCVPVVSFQFDDFPAFYVRESGFRSPWRIDQLAEVAASIVFHHQIGRGGFLVTTPTRVEDAIDRSVVETAITDALHAAKTSGVAGKAVTNHVMRAVNLATDGLSDQANAAVLISNARFAAELAVVHASVARNSETELMRSAS
jgi:pseudouridine-5'-phosphate glycosidase